MPREASKCREWEKERRDRLKTRFTTLGKLLPCYDPSIALSKIEILQKAAAYIEELQAKVKDLLSAETANKPEREEIRRLHTRIKKLLVRNEQIGNLLKDAGIKLPTECGVVRKFKDPRPWSNRITPEQSKVLAKREAQKENEPKKTKSVKRAPNTAKKLPPKKRKTIRKADFKVKKVSPNTNSAVNLNFTQAKLITLVSTQSCFIITNAPSNSVCRTSSVKSTTVVTNSRIFSSPMVAATVQPTPSIMLTKANTTLKPLTTGTFLVPVLSQPTLIPNSPLLTTTPTLVNSLSGNNTTLIVVSKSDAKVPTPTSVAVSPTKSVKDSTPATSPNKAKTGTTSKVSETTKSLAVLRPKIDLTKTTQSNKVPIPASRYASSFVFLPANSNCVPASLNCAPTTSKCTPKPKPSKPKVAQKKASKATAAKNKKDEENLKNSRNAENAVKASESVNNARDTQNHGGCEEKNSVGENLTEAAEIAENLHENQTKAGNLQEHEDNVGIPQENQNNVETVEPSAKKRKLSASLDNVGTTEGNSDFQISAKVGTSSAYSVDSLCTEIAQENALVLPPVEENNTVTSKHLAETEVVGRPEEASSEIRIEQEQQRVPTASEEKPHEAEPAPAPLINSEDVPLDVDATERSTAKEDAKDMDLPDTLAHSELSNDIFASLSHVSTGGQNPESTSPTAAFLLAFPLVSSLTSLKVTEVMEEETSDSQHGTPTLLQIGTMGTTKTTQTHPDSLTPNLLNLDNFSFFSSKDICCNFYPQFENIISSSAMCPATVTKTMATATTAATTVVAAAAATVATAAATAATNSAKTDVIAREKREFLELNPTKTKSCEKITTNPPQVFSVPESVVASTSSSGHVTASVLVASAASSSQDKKASQNSLTSMPATSSYSLAATYSQPGYAHIDTVATISVQQSVKQKHNTEKQAWNNTAPSSHSYSLPQYNTFNPFTDIPKSNSTYTNVSKPYNDPIYANNSNYSYNYHSDNFNINYPATAAAKTGVKSDKYYGLNYANAYEYKSSENQRNQQFGYYSQNQLQIREKQSVSNNQSVKNSSKITNNSLRQPVNWMTTPDVRQPTQTQPDFLVPPFTKEMEFSSNSIYPTNSFVSAPQTTYFNSYSASDLHNTFGDNRKIEGAFPPIPPNTFQKNDVDDNQFWSPTKLPQLLDPPHGFVSSTLPTLVGDLALGNTQPLLPFMDQKGEKVRVKDNSRRSKPQATFDNQSNFLSVSQLVDHSKTDGVAPRITSRRNSGNRSSKSNAHAKTKRVQKSAENKETSAMQNYTTNKEKSHIKHQSHSGQTDEFSAQSSGELFWSVNNKGRHVNKNAPSSYSAEALIGHQSQVDSTMIKQRHQENYPAVNKSLPVPFLADNIISYFPPVDIPQDNNFLQQNQNYQSGSFGHNFPSSIQNNVYSTNSFVPNAPTITTTYLSSTNFMSDIGSHDYIPDNVFPHAGNRVTNKNPGKQNHNGRSEDSKRNMQQASTSCSVISSNAFPKKSKRRPTNESNLPGFVDFSFLSMPSAINSPILPDDFHAHSNFLPPPTPTQLYPCKNPLYQKQPPDLVPSTLLPIPAVSRTGIQHPEISPSLNNVGTTSLTNFNLSTIFPEINKGSGQLSDIYADSSKAKEYMQRDFLGNSTQVPFASKSNLPMSYINSTSST